MANDLAQLLGQISTQGNAPFAESVGNGLAALAKSVNELSAQRSLGQANDAIRQIKSSEADEQQKFNALQDVGTQLATHLMQTGQSTAEIKQALGLTGLTPESIQTVQEGLFSQSPSTRGRAEQLQKEQRDFELQKVREMGQFGIDRAVASGGRKSDKDKATLTTNLRKSTDNLTKRYAPVFEAAKEIDVFTNNPSGYGDIALLYNTMKGALDPQSVVRESEAKMFQSVGTTKDRAITLVNKMATGQFLDERQRKELAGVLTVIRTNKINSYKSQLAPIVKQAQANEIDLDQVLPEQALPLFGAQPAPAQGPASTAASSAQAPLTPSPPTKFTGPGWK